MGIEVFGLQLFVAVAGTEDVEAGAHQIEGGAVGRHVEKPYPKVEVAAIRRKINLRADRPSDLQVVRKRLTVKDQSVAAPCQGAIIMSTIGGIRVRKRLGGVRTNRRIE